jgi:hypothetical protein
LDPRDVTVGVVAIVFGLALVGAAMTDARWLFELHKSRWLVRTLGVTGTKLLFFVLGSGLVALGVVIALGYRPPWSKPGREKAQAVRLGASTRAALVSGPPWSRSG